MDYLKRLPVRVRTVIGEEGEEKREVPSVPDCSYMLRRRPSNSYLLLAVSNRTEPIDVTSTLHGIEGLPGKAMEYLDYREVQIHDGRIRDSFEPFGVRAYIIEPR